MGGSEGVRGYLLQTLSTVLDATWEDVNWTSLAIEPHNERDVVDVLWSTPEGDILVQVKSSKNKLLKADIVAWAAALEAARHAIGYRLILIGNASESVVTLGRVGAVEVPPPLPNNMDMMLQNAAHSVASYLERRRYRVPLPSVCLRIAQGLTTKLLQLASDRVAIDRNNFDAFLREWVSDVLGIARRPSWRSVAPGADLLADVERLANALDEFREQLERSGANGDAVAAMATAHVDVRTQPRSNRSALLDVMRAASRLLGTEHEAYWEEVTAILETECSQKPPGVEADDILGFAAGVLAMLAQIDDWTAYLSDSRGSGNHLETDLERLLSLLRDHLHTQSGAGPGATAQVGSAMLLHLCSRLQDPEGIASYLTVTRPGARVTAWEPFAHYAEWLESRSHFIPAEHGSSRPVRRAYVYAVPRRLSDNVGLCFCQIAALFGACSTWLVAPHNDALRHSLNRWVALELLLVLQHAVDRLAIEQMASHEWPGTANSAREVFLVVSRIMALRDEYGSPREETLWDRLLQERPVHALIGLYDATKRHLRGDPSTSLRGCSATVADHLRHACDEQTDALVDNMAAFVEAVVGDVAMYCTMDRIMWSETGLRPSKDDRAALVNRVFARITGMALADRRTLGVRERVLRFCAHRWAMQLFALLEEDSWEAEFRRGMSSVAAVDPDAVDDEFVAGAIAFARQHRSQTGLAPGLAGELRSFAPYGGKQELCWPSLESLTEPERHALDVLRRVLSGSNEDGAEALDAIARDAKELIVLRGVGRGAGH